MSEKKEHYVDSRVSSISEDPLRYKRKINKKRGCQQNNWNPHEYLTTTTNSWYIIDTCNYCNKKSYTWNYKGRKG